MEKESFYKIYKKTFVKFGKNKSLEKESFCGKVSNGKCFTKFGKKKSFLKILNFVVNFNLILKIKAWKRKAFIKFAKKFNIWSEKSLKFGKNKSLEKESFCGKVSNRKFGKKKSFEKESLKYNIIICPTKWMYKPYTSILMDNFSPMSGEDV